IRDDLVTGVQTCALPISEGQFVLPRREVSGSTAEDLPEVIATKVPGPLLVRAGPRQDPGVRGRRIDFEHVERKIDALERGDPRRSEERRVGKESKEGGEQ